MTLDLAPYENTWVAVRGEEVVASAEDEQSLRANPAVQAGDDIYPVGEPPSGFYLLNV